MAQIISADFEQVKPRSTDESACSPHLERDFVGIRLNAPSVVHYTPGHKEPFSGAFARILICGAYTLNSAFVTHIGNVPQSITVVAKNLDSQAVYTGKLDPGHPMRPSRYQYSEEERAAMERQFVSGWFNENIAEYLPIPAAPARYDVFVTLGAFASNIVTIAVRSTEHPDTD